MPRPVQEVRCTGIATVRCSAATSTTWVSGFERSDSSFRVRGSDFPSWERSFRGLERCSRICDGTLSQSRGSGMRDPVREGLELWEAGRLVEAEQKYREAFALTAEGHWGRPEVRAGLAAILAAQGKSAEALEEFEATLREELALSGDNQASPSVVAARYFLAEHLLHQGNPEAALTALAPSLGTAGDFSLRLVEARACAATGDTGRAIELLRALMARATTDEQRADLELQISAVDALGTGR